MCKFQGGDIITIMTREWRGYIQSICGYVIQQRQINPKRVEQLTEKDDTSLFNSWADARGTAIDDPELAIWCKNYIRRMVNMPLQRLIKAAEIDRLRNSK